LPRLVELNGQFKDRGVTFVSIDHAPRPKAAEAFFVTEKVVHTVLGDPTGSVFDSYRITGTPTTVIIDAEGRVIFRHVGYAPGDEVRLAKEIESLVTRKGNEA
jgi:cytochrome c biogenesis protein CcmG, thiol:disulfide interchange protein DsbE